MNSKWLNSVRPEKIYCPLCGQYHEVSRELFKKNNEICYDYVPLTKFTADHLLTVDCDGTCTRIFLYCKENSIIWYTVGTRIRADSVLKNANWRLMLQSRSDCTWSLLHKSPIVYSSFKKELTFDKFRIAYCHFSL